MKKFALKFWMVLLVSAVVLSGCKKDSETEEPAAGNFSTLKSYMVSNSLDLTDMLKDWVIDAKLTTDGGIVDPTDNSIPSMNVVDIRDAAPYAAGHIKGAVNVPLANIVEGTKTMTDKPILVVCATGQTAGVACMALRLSGFANAKVLKFGMAGWNDQFSAPWVSAGQNAGVGSPNWVTTAAPANGSFGYPTWTSTSIDGKTILAERVKAVVDAGFAPTAPADILANPANFTIINYWPESDYTTFGHFAGAYRINPITLAADEIKGIDPSKTVQLYCYTGMTSSFVSTWLNVLGYNVKSIKFGANALVHDQLDAAGKTVFHGSKGYTFVTGK